MLMKKDLRAIGRYVSDGFGALGILASAPTVLEDGSVGVNCKGIDPGDVDVAADRIAQVMDRNGWDVDVWVDERTGDLRIDDKEHEAP